MSDSFNKTAESKRPIIYFMDWNKAETNVVKNKFEIHAIKDDCNSVFLYGVSISFLLPDPAATSPLNIPLSHVSSPVVIEHHDALMGLIDQFKTFRPDLARNPQLIALQNAAKARH
ncbi:hypothetical protein D3C87_616230 [compost metagenome]